MPTSIEFKPNNGRGGRMTLNEPLSGAEVEKLYLDWLVTTHPELKGEVVFDNDTNTLFIGQWEMDITFEISEIQFELAGDTSDEADQEKDQKTEEQVAEEDIASILLPQAQLDVVRIHGDSTMSQAQNLQSASTLPTYRGLYEINANRAISEIESAPELSTFAAQPAIDRAVPAANLFFKNKPQQQPRHQNAKPSTYENTTMGKQRNSDERERAGRVFRDDQRNTATRRNDPYPSRNRNFTSSRESVAANAELINQLLANGIGSARTSVDPEEYLRNRRIEQAQARRVNDSDYQDGITCINVSAAAETQLGKALRLAETREIDYPNLGRFNSLGGLYLSLTENPCGGYNHLSANAAHKELHANYDYWRELYACEKLSQEQFNDGVKGYYDFRAIYSIMADALWIRVNQDPELVGMLLQNRLAFECYTWVRRNNQNAEQENSSLALRHELYGAWYIPLLREVVRSLRARMNALQNGKSGDQLPTPNFTGEIELGFTRLRRRQARDMERRKLGFFRQEPKRGPRKPKVQLENGVNVDIFGAEAAEKAGTLGVTTMIAGEISVTKEQLADAYMSVFSEPAPENFISDQGYKGPSQLAEMELHAEVIDRKVADTTETKKSPMVAPLQVFSTGGSFN